jgi:segregation and condensation protein B
VSDRSEVSRALEALLFLADEPMASSQLAQVVERPRAEVEATLVELAADYERRDSGLALRTVAGGGGCTRIRTWRRSSNTSSCRPGTPG